MKIFHPVRLLVSFILVNLNYSSGSSPDKPIFFKPASFYPVYHFLTQNPDENQLIRWIDDENNLKAFISNSDHLVYLLNHSHQNFTILYPRILEHFNNFFLKNPNEYLTDYHGYHSLWLSIQFALLKHASIEELKAMLQFDVLQEIVINHSSRSSPAFNNLDPSTERLFWPIPCCCSERKCFSNTDPEIQEKEAEELVALGIFDRSLESYSVTNDFGLAIPSILLRKIYNRLGISLLQPSHVLQFAYLSAWDLVHPIIDNWGVQAFNCQTWIGILILSARADPEAFQGLYKIAPKNNTFVWELFSCSLQYRELGHLSYKLWEGEVIQKMIKNVPITELLCRTLPSPKYLLPFLNYPDFCDQIVKNFDTLASMDYTDMAVDTFKSSKIFCKSLLNTFSEEVAYAKYTNYLADAKHSVAQILESCYGFRMTAELANEMAKQIYIFNPCTFYRFIDRYWEVLGNSSILACLRHLVEKNLGKQALYLLQDRSQEYNLSEIVNGLKLTKACYLLIERIGLLDNVVVDIDGYSCFPVHFELAKLLKRSHKSTGKFTNQIESLEIGWEHYTWAAQYCIFHDDSILLAQIGHQMVKKHTNQVAYSFAAVALEVGLLMAINESTESDRILPLEILTFIIRELYRDAASALEERYRPFTS